MCWKLWKAASDVDAAVVGKDLMLRRNRRTCVVGSMVWLRRRGV